LIDKNEQFCFESDRVTLNEKERGENFENYGFRNPEEINKGTQEKMGEL
jgi:hypothetical protein